MHDGSLFYCPHWSTLADIEVPSMMYCISCPCSKRTGSIGHMWYIVRQRAVWYRETEIHIACLKNCFYVSEKLSQTERRKSVVIFYNRTCFKCISQCLTSNIRESFSRRKSTIYRHDVVDASIFHDGHTTFSSEFPSHDFITIWFTQYWLWIRTDRCQLGAICIIKSQKHRCSVIERCHSWEKYLYRWCFRGCHDFSCWFWYEYVGKCDE